MSSTEQAFVKAFARRNRTSESTASTKVNPVAESAADRCENEPTGVWIDQVDDQTLRADVGQPVVPRPHIEPKPSATHQDAEVVDDPVDVDAMIDSLQQSLTSLAAVDVPDELLWVQATEVASIDPYELASQFPEQSTEQSTEQMIATAEVDIPTDCVRENAPEPTTTHPAKPFRAAWEVDVFDVPKVVADLFFAENLFQDLSDRMREAIRGGMRTMLVTSKQAGEGRSSVAIGIALAAGASGSRVALVDADVDEPTLMNDLRLELEFGWLDTIRSGLPIKEIAIHAVEDAVTLIPLMPDAASNPAKPEEISQLIELLRDSFDLIVIDGPPGTSSSLQPLASVIDSAVIVRDSDRTGGEDLNRFASWLTDVGVRGVGMVENFIA